MKAERATGTAVSNRMLQEEVKSIATRVYLKDQYVPRRQKPENISIRASTNESQKLPTDCAETIAAF